MDSLAGSPPSFYEMVAQDLFSTTLADSLTFVLDLFASRFAGPFIQTYVPELSAALMSLFDGLSLNVHSATLTENFYGLTRHSNGTQAFLGFVLLKHWGPVLQLRLLNSRWLTAVYNAVKAGLMTHYAYLKGSYYSPPYWLTRTQVIRQTQVKPFNWHLFGLLMALKALEVWAGLSSSPRVSESKVVSPPYSASKVRSGRCGICNKSPVNATALIESGYVFCYSCISDQVTRHRCCPVSGLPAQPSSLRTLHSLNSQ